MKTPREKYQNDPAYARLVEFLAGEIDRAHYTPSELREAATFACILYQERVGPALTSRPDDINKALEFLHEWADTPENDQSLNMPAHINRRYVIRRDDKWLFDLSFGFWERADIGKEFKIDGIRSIIRRRTHFGRDPNILSIFLTQFEKEVADDLS